MEPTVWLTPRQIGFTRQGYRSLICYSLAGEMTEWKPDKLRWDSNHAAGAAVQRTDLYSRTSTLLLSDCSCVIVRNTFVTSQMTAQTFLSFYALNRDEQIWQKRILNIQVGKLWLYFVEGEDVLNSLNKFQTLDAEICRKPWLLETTKKQV